MQQEDQHSLAQLLPSQIPEPTACSGRTCNYTIFTHTILLTKLLLSSQALITELLKAAKWYEIQHIRQRKLTMGQRISPGSYHVQPVGSGSRHQSIRAHRQHGPGSALPTRKQQTVAFLKSQLIYDICKLEK